jgi:Ca2+/H+ antiporter
MSNGFVYVLAAFGCLVLGLIGGDYTFLIVILMPAVLCLVQAHYQWRPMWVVIFSLYLIGSLAYGGLLLVDVIALVSGKRPQVLLDLDDSVVFVVLLSYIITVTWLLYRARPWRARSALSSNNALEQTRDG